MVQRKKEYRWESGRAFVDHLLPTLPGPSYVAVVMYCWFRARGESNTFTESTKQISNACRINCRRVSQIMADLERAGCIKTIRKGGGAMPSTRCLVRKKYKAPPSGLCNPLPKPLQPIAETPATGCTLPDAEHLVVGSVSLRPYQSPLEGYGIET